MKKKYLWKKKFLTLVLSTIMVFLSVDTTALAVRGDVGESVEEEAEQSETMESMKETKLSDSDEGEKETDNDGTQDDGHELLGKEGEDSSETSETESSVSIIDETEETEEKSCDSVEKYTEIEAETEETEEKSYDSVEKYTEIEAETELETYGNETVSNGSSNDLNTAVYDKLNQYRSDSAFGSGVIWGGTTDGSYNWNGWYQCCGFALQFANTVFGTYPATLRIAANGATYAGWTCYYVTADNYNTLTVEPGDIIDSPSGYDNSGKIKHHTAMVLSGNNSNFTCVQCNYKSGDGVNNKIHYGEYFNYNTNRSSLPKLWAVYGGYTDSGSHAMRLWKPSDSLKRGATGSTSGGSDTPSVSHGCDASITVDIPSNNSIIEGNFSDIELSIYDYHGIKSYSVTVKDRESGEIVRSWSDNLSGSCGYQISTTCFLQREGNYEITVNFECANGSKYTQTSYFTVSNPNCHTNENDGYGGSIKYSTDGDWAEISGCLNDMHGIGTYVENIYLIEDDEEILVKTETTNCGDAEGSFILHGYIFENYGLHKFTLTQTCQSGYVHYYEFYLNYEDPNTEPEDVCHASGTLTSSESYDITNKKTIILSGNVHDDSGLTAYDIYYRLIDDTEEKLYIEQSGLYGKVTDAEFEREYFTFPDYGTYYISLKVKCANQSIHEVDSLVLTYSDHSGKIGDILWDVDENGHLTITGEGDYINYITSSTSKPPWSGKDVKTAKVSVTGITSTANMFHDCSNLTNVNLSELDTSNVTEMICMFSDCSNLTSLDLSSFQTENVTDMQAMFSGCSALTQLDLNSFDVKNVTNMESMFRDCASLTELDLSSFDTSSVQNMSQMFAGCKNLSKLTIDSFRTENVTTMERMFLGCESLTDLDLSGFQTGNVTTMEFMFNDCKSLARLTVNSFDTRRVETVMEMFGGCTSLTELDLSSFDLSGLTDEMPMLESCDALKKIYAPRRLSVSIPLMVPDNFEEEQDTHWYQGKDIITELPKNLNVSILLTRGQETSVTETYITAAKKKTVYACGETLGLDDLMVQYYGADAKVTSVTNYTTNKDEIDMSTAGVKELRITYQDGEKELTAVVKLTVLAAAEGNIAEGVSQNITWTIDQTGKLTITGSGDYEHSNGQVPWYDYRARIKSAVVQVTDMTNASAMFADSINLIDVDLSSFDIKTVTDMSDLFRDCAKLTKISFVNPDTKNVKDLSSAFSGCVSLTRLDLSGFDTQNVKDLSFLFHGCTRLEEVDLSSFDTQKVTDISGMFAYCKSLSFLDLSSFDLSGMKTINDAQWVEPFLGCDGLEHLRTPINCSVAVTLPGSEDGIMWYPSIDVTLWEIPNLKTSVDLFKGEFPTVELTITYDLQGHGTPIATETTEYGKKLTAPQMPTEEGYTFGGWYREKECIHIWDFDIDTVKDSMTLYAKWTKNSIVVDDIDDSAYTQDERTDLGTIGGSIANIKNKIYDGSPYEPTVKVTVIEAGKKKTLTEGADYRVLYDKNTDAGTQGTATVKGNGRYKGTLTATFTINPKPVKKLKLTVGSMTVGDSQKPPVYVYDGGKLLLEGTDYQLSYDKNLTTQPAKAAVVTINGLGNYTGSTTVKLAVYASDASKRINPEDVTLSAEKTSYTGKAVKTVTPTVKTGTVILQPNKDYKVQYQNNKDAGTAFVIVKGKGDYTGTVVKTFEITPVTSSLGIQAIPDKTYNGKLQKPSISVMAGAKKLSKKDYTVTYTKNLHAGAQTAQVTVTGRGNYAGIQQTAVFTIHPQKIAKASVKGVQGSLTLIYNKNILKEGTDYTLQYGEVIKDKIIVTITGKGDFTGSVTKKIKAQNNGGNQDKEPEKPDEKESGTSDGKDKKPDKPVDDEKERAIQEKLQRIYQELALNSLSELDKIGTIYDYVTNNVTYDSKSESEMRYTVYGALIEGKAVCQGYALLLERMLEDNGIASQYIAGIGLSCAGGPERHAWNIVEYNGFYYNVDATWDCTNGKTRKWFLKSQADFEDHVRDAQYETEAFLKKYPVAKY